MDPFVDRQRSPDLKITRDKSRGDTLIEFGLSLYGTIERAYYPSLIGNKSGLRVSVSYCRVEADDVCV